MFTGWSGTARIAWPERGASLVMAAERPLSFLTLYTPAGEPYFCAEPVSNITNAFNLAPGRDDTGLIVLTRCDRSRPGCSSRQNSASRAV